ncbi:hypothetical protein AB0O34_03080 [Sphaerisporangium sp. NPDC088356]|uniref:hypothetical protein n=1 Tax=Sphaerisporangium sp. NPDC088356 TaxID=3154871 RepID=UPI00342D0AE6
MSRIRATTIAVAMTVLALAGCSAPAGDDRAFPTTAGEDRSGPATAGESPEPTTTDQSPEPATARQMVALWNSYGGFAGNRLRKSDPPALAVYGDGLVIAHADRSLPLKGTELTDLLRALRDDLASQPATADPTGVSQIADARTMVLGVRVDDTMHTVTAYALDETRSDRGYPDGLYHARDLLGALAERVSREGSTYTTDRVRLIAEPRPGQTGDKWPSPLPEPGASEDGGFDKVLKGTQAAEARRVLVRARQDGAWPVYHDHQGRPFAVTWRYALPSE